MAADRAISLCAFSLQLSAALDSNKDREMARNEEGHQPLSNSLFIRNIRSGTGYMGVVSEVKFVQKRKKEILQISRITGIESNVVLFPY